PAAPAGAEGRDADRRRAQPDDGLHRRARDAVGEEVDMIVCLPDDPRVGPDPGPLVARGGVDEIPFTQAQLGALARDAGGVAVRPQRDGAGLRLARLRRGPGEVRIHGARAIVDLDIDRCHGYLPWRSSNSMRMPEAVWITDWVAFTLVTVLTVCAWGTVP